MSARSAGMLLLLLTLGSGGLSMVGPGDPVSVFVSGFTTPCRTSFDGAGNLYVVDLGVHGIYKVTPNGTTSLVTDQIATPRGITFDAFGNLLVADPVEGTVYRISPQGTVTPFLEVVRAQRPRVGPNGDIWVASVDSLHHFDAMGRPLEHIDVHGQGAGAWGLQFTPDGVLYVTNSASFWTLSGQTVIPVLTGMTPANSAPHFDMEGRAYWTHQAMAEGDTHRVIQGVGNLSIVADTFAALPGAPCAIVFGRDPGGAMTNRLFVSLRDGSIVELNTVGIPAPGVPEVGLSLTDLDPSEVANEILGAASQVTANQTHFLDALGNNNGSYDVGDFRAYLMAAGVLN